jgi:hypothetical protein
VQCGTVTVTGTGGSSIVTSVIVVIPTIIASGLEILECCGCDSKHCPEEETEKGSLNTHHISYIFPNPVTINPDVG